MTVGDTHRTTNRSWVKCCVGGGRSLAHTRKTISSLLRLAIFRHSRSLISFPISQTSRPPPYQSVYFSANPKRLRPQLVQIWEVSIVLSNTWDLTSVAAGVFSKQTILLISLWCLRNILPYLYMISHSDLSPIRWNIKHCAPFICSKH